MWLNWVIQSILLLWIKRTFLFLQKNIHAFHITLSSQISIFNWKTIILSRKSIIRVYLRISHKQISFASIKKFLLQVRRQAIIGCYTRQRTVRISMQVIIKREVRRQIVEKKYRKFYQKINCISGNLLITIIIGKAL